MSKGARQLGQETGSQVPGSEMCTVTRSADLLGAELDLRRALVPTRQKNAQVLGGGNVGRAAGARDTVGSCTARELKMARGTAGRRRCRSERRADGTSVRAACRGRPRTSVVIASSSSGRGPLKNARSRGACLGRGFGGIQGEGEGWGGSGKGGGSGQAAQLSRLGLHHSCLHAEPAAAWEAAARVSAEAGRP